MCHLALFPCAFHHCIVVTCFTLCITLTPGLVSPLWSLVLPCALLSPPASYPHCGHLFYLVYYSHPWPRIPIVVTCFTLCITLTPGLVSSLSSLVLPCVLLSPLVSSVFQLSGGRVLSSELLTPFTLGL